MVNNMTLITIITAKGFDIKQILIQHWINLVRYAMGPICLRSRTKLMPARWLHGSCPSLTKYKMTYYHGWSFSVYILHCFRGAGRSSEVERSLMVRWVVGSILHGVDPLSYFSFQPVLHDWCNKGRGMCYPVCGMVHIKEPLLLIDKSSLCGGSGFPFSLSEWSLTICLKPYNRR